MGIVIRQGIKGTIVTYIGVIVGAFNLLWLFPKVLTPAEIGLTRVVIDISLLIAALSQFGAPNITDKFFPFFRDEQQKHKGFFFLLIIYPLIGFLLVGGVFLLFKNIWIDAYQARSPLLLDYFYHIIPLAFFIMYINVLEAYSRAHYRIVVPTIIREIFLRLFQASVVVLYHFDIITLNHLIILIIVSYAVAVFLLVGYIKNLQNFFITYKDAFINKALLKEMLFFGLFIFIGGAWGLVASKIDVIMLSSMKNLGNAGVYSIAFFIGTVIEIPRRAFTQISTPLISQALKNDDKGTIEKLYSKIALNQLIIGLLLFLLIWCNIDFIFSIIPNSEAYATGKYVVLLIALGRLTDMATGVNTEIILNSSYYKFNFFIIFVNAFMLVGLNYFFISLYGMEGAALSTLISFVLFNVIKSIFIYRKFEIQPFSFKTILILFFGAIAYIGVFFVPEINVEMLFPFINIAFRSFFITILFLGPIFYFKISPDIDAFIGEFFKRMKVKK